MLFEANIRDILRLFPSYRLQKEKSEMRELLTQKRRLLTQAERDQAATKVMEQLEAMHCFRQAKTILLYYPIHKELDLLPLIKKYKHEKTILLPVTHRKYMEARPYKGNALMKRGRYNIPEPQTEPYKGTIDIVLVPGVAFDKHCNRLGRGGGFYDKFLSHCAHTMFIGVGYDFQLVDEIPTNRKDIRMHRVILPSQTIEGKSAQTHA